VVNALLKECFINGLISPRLSLCPDLFSAFLEEILHILLCKVAVVHEFFDVLHILKMIIDHRCGRGETSSTAPVEEGSYRLVCGVACQSTDGNLHHLVNKLVMLCLRKRHLEKW